MISSDHLLVSRRIGVVEGQRINIKDYIKKFPMKLTQEAYLLPAVKIVGSSSEAFLRDFLEQEN